MIFFFLFYYFLNQYGSCRKTVDARNGRPHRKTSEDYGGMAFYTKAPFVRLAAHLWPAWSTTVSRRFSTKDTSRHCKYSPRRKVMPLKSLNTLFLTFFQSLFTVCYASSDRLEPNLIKNIIFNAKRRIFVTRLYSTYFWSSLLNLKVEGHHDTMTWWFLILTFFSTWVFGRYFSAALWNTESYDYRFSVFL